MAEFTIKELTLKDLFPNLLQHFNRYQEVQRCFRMENKKWVLKDISFTEQWDETLKKGQFFCEKRHRRMYKEKTILIREIVSVDFTNCLNSGGVVWGVFNKNNELIAFASLLSDFFGSENQYLQLMQIHVSFEWRNKGLGKKLFKACSEKAKTLGAKKLYISTHSSEESQSFYESVGCIDAKEINIKLAEYEPYDRQMEFVL
jgi:GNAT superfamily N-acetyltransferase